MAGLRFAAVGRGSSCSWVRARASRRSLSFAFSFVPALAFGLARLVDRVYGAVARVRLHRLLRRLGLHALCVALPKGDLLLRRVVVLVRLVPVVRLCSWLFCRDRVDHGIRVPSAEAAFEVECLGVGEHRRHQGVVVAVALLELPPELVPLCLGEHLQEERDLEVLREPLAGLSLPSLDLSLPPGQCVRQ